MIDYQVIVDFVAEMIEYAMPIAILFALVGKLLNMLMSMMFNGKIDL